MIIVHSLAIEQRSLNQQVIGVIQSQNLSSRHLPSARSRIDLKNYADAVAELITSINIWSILSSKKMLEKWRKYGSIGIQYNYRK